MELPKFDTKGNLPLGVYLITLQSAMERFGVGSPKRVIVASRLDRIYRLVASTKKLVRFIVFGSFVTQKTEPRDLDLVLIMDDSFHVSQLTGDVGMIFRHAEADAFFGASIFWTTRSGAFGGEQAMVEYWQLCRDGGKRGILEIVPESS